MSAHLQKQIQTRMAEKHLSAYSLEKKAGLGRSAVGNILRGLSTKPSAEVLMAIAEVLECTVYDLMSGSKNADNIVESKIKTTTTTRNNHIWNEKLYTEAVKAISKYLEEKALHLKSEQVISLIKEVYLYSLNKGSEKIDQDFTKWLVNKNL